MTAGLRATSTAPDMASAMNTAPPSWSLMLLSLSGDLVSPVPARARHTRQHSAPKTDVELPEESRSPRRAARQATNV